MMNNVTYTLLFIRRKIAFYETEIAHQEDSKQLWFKKFEHDLPKQLASVRQLQRVIRANQNALAYWQGYLADWVQS
jgi:hypothetical protein